MSNVKSTEGSVPLSKSQLRKKAKKGEPIRHGGICNKCGQSSSSCTTGTKHLNCDGFAGQEKLSPIFDAFLEKYPGRLQGRYITADGSPINDDPGYWLTKEAFEYAKVENVRFGEQLVAARDAKLREEKHAVVIDGKVVFQNGLGEPIELKSPMVFTNPEELSLEEEQALLAIHAAKVPIAATEETWEEVKKEAKPIKELKQKKVKEPKQKKNLPAPDPGALALAQGFYAMSAEFRQKTDAAFAENDKLDPIEKRLRQYEENEALLGIEDEESGVAPPILFEQLVSHGAQEV